MDKKIIINKKIIQRHFFFTIPFTIIWILLFGYYHYTEKVSNVNAIIIEELANNKATAAIIANYIQELKEGIFVIRDSNEMQLYLNNFSQENKNNLEKLFFRIIKNKSSYDQMRFLDTVGQELIRVDNTNNGPKIIKDLQNKSRRFYFKDAIKQNDGEIYISRLDLNIENETIDPLLKPMLRVATPLYSIEGTLYGVLVINFKADRFIDLLLNQSDIPYDLDTLTYICNSEGQFIDHPEDSFDFSFMFEESKNAKFSDIYPSIWEAINAKEKGIINKNKKGFIFYDVLSETKKRIPEYHEKWILIHVIDKSNILCAKSILSSIFTPLNLLILFIIHGLILISIILDAKIRNQNYELKIAHEIASGTNDAIIITNADTEITHINKAYEEATGYSQKEVIGHKPNEFKSGQHDKDFYESMWRDINQKGLWEGTLWDKRKDGVFYPKRLRIIEVRKKKNRPVSHYIGIFKTLSEQERKHNSFDINIDDSPDLKIANEEMLIQFLNKNIKENSFNFMVLCIAIENFNQLISLHDNFNQNTISRLFIDLVKPLIHKNDLITQTSRNMYSVIINLKYIDSKHDVFITNFYQSLSQIIKKENCELFFKTRMGISFWPNDTNDIKMLLLHSIIALEWSMKRQSKEYAFYDSEMIKTIKQENKIERHLKKAISLKELYIAYQPQVDAITGSVVGAEALIRWNNNEMGNVPPGEFIPIAEKSAIIIELGYWILEQVCKDLKHLLEQEGITFNHFKIAVNISAMQLEDPYFPEKALSIIDSYSLDHHLIEFEITESLLLSNYNKNIHILKSFRSKDISIALDDFGTGYSSLSYLHKLPIDKMKIDRSFIRNFPEMDDGKMAKILVDMSKMLEIEVLTEGVENIEQLKYLKEIGCRIIQGYYFSKPIDFESFSYYLKETESIKQ